MAELKTKQTEASVKDFLNQIPDKQRRDDCFAIVKMMEEATGAKPKMWGPSIVGFWQLSLQVRERARRRLDDDRLLTAQERSDALSHDGNSEASRVDGAVGETQNE
jgi:hypothetical protein